MISADVPAAALRLTLVMADRLTFEPTRIGVVDMRLFFWYATAFARAAHHDIRPYNQPLCPAILFS